jgi:hypothetical protein
MQRRINIRELGYKVLGTVFGVRKGRHKIIACYSYRDPEYPEIWTKQFTLVDERWRSGYDP